jgi:hypothetical protein
MVLFLLVLFIVVSICLIIIESVNLYELGTPPKDSDILEMLEKYETEYTVDKKWNNKFKLKTTFRSETPNIVQTQYSVIFPYYVNGVGLIPIWYKSTKIIEGLFKDRILKSKYKITKRDKLGL